MQLLADAVDTYEETAMARWWEWEAASDGRRQLTWSTGTRDLRALAGLGREATDEEIAEEDQDADARLVLPARTWTWMSERGLESRALQLAEDVGLDSVAVWLVGRGLEVVRTIGAVGNPRNQGDASLGCITGKQDSVRSPDERWCA